MDERLATDMELRPGEMSLHHPNIIHGSNPNRSGEKRIGFIIRFVTGRAPRTDRPLVRAHGEHGGGLDLAGEPVFRGSLYLRGLASLPLRW